MAVKLRLVRVGKTKQPTYRVVAADSRSPRDGRFIEIVGHYDPRSEPSVVEIDNDKALKWLRQGRPAHRAGPEAARDLGRVGRVHGCDEVSDIEGDADSTPISTPISMTASTTRSTTRSRTTPTSSSPTSRGQP